MEEPIRIAVEDLCYLCTQISIWFTKSVYDLAEMGFIDSDHLGQTILPNPNRVHPEFQIWVDIAINWHLVTQHSPLVVTAFVGYESLTCFP